MGIFDKLFRRKGMRYKCRSCGALQADGAWEKAKDAEAKATGATGFHNISAKPACLKCGSLDLIDFWNPPSDEEIQQKIDIYKLSERQELIRLCKQYDAEYSKYAIYGHYDEQKLERIKDRIRTIGERLGDEGGRELMLDMGESLENPKWRNIVDSCWDGIHGWMY